MAAAMRRGGSRCSCSGRRAVLILACLSGILGLAASSSSVAAHCGAAAASIPDTAGPCSQTDAGAVGDADFGGGSVASPFKGIERTPSAAKLKGFLEDFARQSQESEVHAEGQVVSDGDTASSSNTAEGGDAARGEEALPTSGQAAAAAAAAGPVTAAADMMGTSRGSWSDVSGAESDDASSSAAEQRGDSSAPGCLGIDLWGELRSWIGVNGGISIHEVCADGSVRSIRRTRRPALRKSKSGETRPQQSQGGAVGGLQRSLSPASLIKAITHLSTSILNKPRSSIVGLAESAYGAALDAKAPPPGVTASHAVSPLAVAAASP